MATKLNLISVAGSGTINFEEAENASSHKASIEIKNDSNENNIAYKIKTTAPRQFVVKPI